MGSRGAVTRNIYVIYVLNVPCHYVPCRVPQEPPRNDFDRLRAEKEVHTA